MSKKRQTTGLPKETPRKPVAEGMPADAAKSGKQDSKREYHSRAEREHEIQRWVLIGTGIAIAATVIILAVAFVLDGVIRPNQVVASVDGNNITVTDFAKRVRLQRVLYNQQLTNVIQTYQSFGFEDQQIFEQMQSQEPFATYMREIQVPDQMGLTVINTMVDERLIRMGAQENDVTVSQADIDKQISQFFGYDPVALADAAAVAESTAEATATVEPSATPTPFVSPTPSPTPTITPTPELTPTASPSPFPTLPPSPTLTTTQEAENFQTRRNDFFTQIRQETGMSDADLNAYFETQALRNALRDKLGSDISKTATFVDARHILVATEEEAQDTLAALKAGDSFSDLAKAISTDTGSGANGGELGWAPISQYVTEFADAAKTAPIGELVGPVKSQFGYHIIQVRASEEREMDDSQLETARNNFFQKWLEEYRKSKLEVTQTFPVWADNVPTDPQTIIG
jgi:parvulin-like peptidyl-prolyl isomerase